MLFLVGMESNASANILTFDDVPGSEIEPGIKWVPNGYGNLNWENVGSVNSDITLWDVTDTGYNRGRFSGEWAAFNTYSKMISITGSFDFNGAYFTSAYYTDDTIEAKGYLAGEEIYNKSWAINNQTPTWINADFKNIDHLTFKSNDIGLAMDNFTYSPTPEPASMLLLGTGLAALAARKLKKQQAA